jgi:hypothetical protein|tara:strand:- start:970 stop:2007 length:1038 start_codon:yes stop_codon:yes gene_type:complete
MDWNLISILSASCIFVGIGLTFSYITTFYLTPYNELYLAGESGMDEQDIPYTIAIIETVVAGLTVIIGMLAVAVPHKIDRNVISIVLIYFIVASIGESVFMTTRLSSLGMIGTNVERTCSDTGVATGCPTTRFEAVHDRPIIYTSPLGGDCQFFFWDEMRSRSMGNTCQLTAPSQSEEVKCEYNVETFMDWSSPKSYGWRDDPATVMSLDDSAGPLTSITKVHNMQQLDFIQTNASNIINKFESQPALAYCYYWGCNAVCNKHRHLINRQWIWSSVAMLITHLIFAMSSALLCRRAGHSSGLPKYHKQEEPLMAIATPVTMSKQLFDMPELGRRKRKLNLSGLKF